jgi:pimeloyl-ACP methyl ester carboxylesterase
MREGSWLTLRHDSVTLACYEYSHSGPPVIFLHGLLGHAREWDDTAEWLSATNRVLALDLRGHGRSERNAPSMTIEDLVDDAVRWAEQLQAGRVVLVGQSLGALVSFLVAARHARLVKGLVVVEASPSPDSDSADRVRQWLLTWPPTFPSREAALAFFGGESLRARAWTNGLEHTAAGLKPAFDEESVLRAVNDSAHRDFWADWRRISCPTIVVRGESGLDKAEAEAMANAIPLGQLATVANARHDVHLEQPEEFNRIVRDFLLAI